MNRVLPIARTELDQVLSHLPIKPVVEIGLAPAMPAVQAGIAQGTFPATLLEPKQDSYLVRLIGPQLWVLGSTERGLWHAVFALEETLAAGTPLDGRLHLQGTFQFRERIFHGRFEAWPATRADVRFLAHLGATHCLVSHDWQGSRRSLQGYVTSPIFPEAVDQTEVAANHAGLRRLLDDCADYGLGAMLWLTELPCQGGPWVPAAARERFCTRYDPEVLGDSGTYEGKVLCFGHAKVQAYYRDLLGRFFHDFPEIETLFLFGLDSGGEFCDPHTCPRCHGQSRMTQRDRLIRFLIQEGQKVRPGLRVLTTGWKWDRDADEFLRHQAELPAASGVYLAAQKDGWQCERQSHDFMHAVRKICRDQEQTFIGYDNFHWGDDTVHGLGDIQDFPLGIGAKLKRWHELGADGVFDHWGHAPEDSWSNSIACREFFLDPNAEAATVCRKLARRQFGDVCGESVFEAWCALELAHVELSPACIWSPGQWPGWYEGRKHYPLPGQFVSKSLLEHQAPPRSEGGRVYNPANFAAALQAVADAWNRALPHYESALRAIDAALALSDDQPVFYHFWWNGDRPTPTRREHLRRQKLYIESMTHAGRDIGLHFALHALWECSGHDAENYRANAEPMLKAAAAACRSAAEYFTALGKPKDWGALYRAKAEAIGNYLKNVES
jgi:hypothetical protein